MVKIEHIVWLIGIYALIIFIIGIIAIGNSGCCLCNQVKEAEKTIKTKNEKIQELENILDERELLIYKYDEQQSQDDTLVNTIKAQRDKCYENLLITKTQHNECKRDVQKDYYYIVKKGDSLSALALIYYNNYELWNIIAQYNNIANPDFIKIHTYLRIKRKITEDEKARAVNAHIARYD